MFGYKPPYVVAKYVWGEDTPNPAGVEGHAEVMLWGADDLPTAQPQPAVTLNVFVVCRWWLLGIPDSRLCTAHSTLCVHNAQGYMVP